MLFHALKEDWYTCDVRGYRIIVSFAVFGGDKGTVVGQHARFLLTVADNAVWALRWQSTVQHFWDANS